MSGGIVDGREQVLGRGPANIFQAHIDAGQWRLGTTCHRLPVVESDQGDVSRHPAPEPAQLLGHAAGNLIAPAEDRLDTRRGPQQDGGGLAAPALRPLAVENAGPLLR